MRNRPATLQKLNAIYLLQRCRNVAEVTPACRPSTIGVRESGGRADHAAADSDHPATPTARTATPGQQAHVHRHRPRCPRRPAPPSAEALRQLLLLVHPDTIMRVRTAAMIEPHFRSTDPGRLPELRPSDPRSAHRPIIRAPSTCAKTTSAGHWTRGSPAPSPRSGSTPPSPHSARLASRQAPHRPQHPSRLKPARRSRSASGSATEAGRASDPPPKEGTPAQRATDPPDHSETWRHYTAHPSDRRRQEGLTLRSPRHQNQLRTRNEDHDRQVEALITVPSIVVSEGGVDG